MFRRGKLIIIIPRSCDLDVQGRRGATISQSYHHEYRSDAAAAAARLPANTPALSPSSSLQAHNHRVNPAEAAGASPTPRPTAANAPALSSSSSSQAYSHTHAYHKVAAAEGASPKPPLAFAPFSPSSSQANDQQYRQVAEAEGASSKPPLAFAPSSPSSLQAYDQQYRQVAAAEGASPKLRPTAFAPFPPSSSQAYDQAYRQGAAAATSTPPSPYARALLGTFGFTLDPDASPEAGFSGNVSPDASPGAGGTSPDASPDPGFSGGMSPDASPDSGDMSPDASPDAGFSSASELPVLAAFSLVELSTMLLSLSLPIPSGCVTPLFVIGVSNNDFKMVVICIGARVNLPLSNLDMHYNRCQQPMPTLFALVELSTMLLSLSLPTPSGCVTPLFVIGVSDIYTSISTSTRSLHIYIDKHHRRRHAPQPMPTFYSLERSIIHLSLSLPIPSGCVTPFFVIGVSDSNILI